MGTRVIVVGGGFAGVKCARTLLRKRRDTEVVLFSRDNHMVFQPLLPDVAGSSLNPRAVAPPLRMLLPRARCRTERVLEIDVARSEIVHEGHDGAPRRMHYDHLVLACGNVVNLNLLPGMGDHALPLKTIGDAIAMRAHVMQQLEKADLAEAADERRFYLTFIVVGGGFSGVEVAGELNDLVRSSRRHYPHVGADDVQVTLLHGPAEILPELSPPLRRFAHQRMTRRGIRVVTGAKVAEVTRRGVTLESGDRIEGATVICTVGTTSNPLVAALDARRERGRLVTAPDLRLEGHENVWAVGDCASVRNAHDDSPAPPTAQFAEREGCQCARNIVRVLRGEPTRAFSFKPYGMACGIGGREGVAEILGLRISGFAAWWMWRSTFLLKIPSLAQKVKVGLDWAWELVFPRDLSHFRPAQSDPVSREHFAPGEVMVRRGQPLKALFAIEKGEAEIARAGAGGAYETLALLGPGTVIGEETLADHCSDGAFVRARSAVDAFVLGKESLSRLSRALAPIEAIVQRAVSRPRASIWRNHPAAMRALDAKRVGDLPTSYRLLLAAPQDPLGAVFQALIDERHGVAVISDGECVHGVATRSDLLEALARGATRSTPIAQAMNAKAVCLKTGDSAALAAERMADQGLKFLPVTDDIGRPVSILTADDFVRFALAMPR